MFKNYMKIIYESRLFWKPFLHIVLQSLLRDEEQNFIFLEGSYVYRYTTNAMTNFMFFNF